MPYPVIPSRRIPYDIDGTEVGHRRTGISNSFSAGVATWATSAQKIQLQNQLNIAPFIQSYGYGNRDSDAFWFFFPELREITHIAFVHFDIDSPSITLQGSANSTNGIDGTWETPVWSPLVSTRADAWRNDILPLSFSGPIKIFRINLYDGSGDVNVLNSIHLYGFKYSGETPDDILFVDAGTVAELTALTDWGDRPEGTTQFRQVKVKNASSSKTANNINLQLNHTDFLMSWNSGGPWTTVLDITSLGAGAESSPIYLKNELGPPLLILGPKDGRIIASVGSWT
ncbi:hypothetical protein EAL2_c06000 [Peptoclostridium acidaminophilum DSM 3953]|uniref:Uncharacterized protein n=1 Tax=Peptoclostridium acidaminophilum DSM 3953 TaxID=1286171 RepID=W8TI69_PEPAC|nr:hypothetical protein [Peptoclostridium acidaminophilum]AHM55902.1 hypothetical protein EAL2_c06000 [Peptoclostridium acidaminophilum DSM 3953]